MAAGWGRPPRDQERRQAPVPAAPAPAFVPVVVQADRRAAEEHVVIDLRGGRVMRLPASMPADRLGAIVRAIEAAEEGAA